MKKILILNGELGTQMQIYLALCEQYKIEIAEDIESVMYYLRKMKPEIFLMDYRLDLENGSGKTGIDLARKLKRKYSDLKIMMIMDGEDASETISLEPEVADHVLMKPVKNQHLVTNMNKLAAARA